MTPAETYKAAVWIIREGRPIDAVRLFTEHYGLKVKEASELVSEIAASIKPKM